MPLGREGSLKSEMRLTKEPCPHHVMALAWAAVPRLATSDPGIKKGTIKTSTEGGDQAARAPLVGSLSRPDCHFWGFGPKPEVMVFSLQKSSEDHLMVWGDCMWLL